MKIEYASLSDPGKVRPNNEDACGAFIPPKPEDLNKKGHLFIVADGMGGHRGGEIASRLAVDSIRKSYFDAEAGDVGRALATAFANANAEIMQESVSDNSLFGMGTTCTAMVLLEGNAYFSHIGDSRAYMLRGATLTQITQDHSLVGEMVRSGIISDEDARTHPKRNVITRSLGVQETADADAPNSPLALQAGDKFLLCSDGLTSYITDEELESALVGENLDGICRQLVDTANARGGRDNITVQLVLVREA